MMPFLLPRAGAFTLAWEQFSQLNMLLCRAADAEARAQVIMSLAYVYNGLKLDMHVKFLWHQCVKDNIANSGRENYSN